MPQTDIAASLCSFYTLVMKPTLARILVIQTWGIGDTLMTIALFRLLRKYFPEAHLTIMVATAEVGRLLGSAGLVDDAIVLTERTSALQKAWFFLRLRSLGFDTAIVATRLSVAYALFARFLAGIPTVITDSTSYFNRVFMPIAPLDREAHRFISNGMLLQPLVPELDVNSIRETSGLLPLVPHSAEARAFAESIFGHGRHVYALHLGSGIQRVKRIPVELASKVVELLLQAQPTTTFLYVQGPGDPPYSSLPDALQQKLTRLAPWPIADLAYLVGKCDAVLTGDTGIAHIAAAGGGRVVTAAGPTDIARTHPWGAQHSVITTRTPPACMPCYGTSRFNNCPYEVKCMTGISPQDIAEALMTEPRLSR